jgi:hypothetical protein
MKLEYFVPQSMTKQSQAALSIYNRNLKMKENGKLETVSGYGSYVSKTKNCREFIEKIIKKYDIQTINDCPCGDINWMKLVNLQGVAYSGFDVINEIVDQNTVNYQDKAFYHVDAIEDVLPISDLIISREFLGHLHNENIKKVLKNFYESGAKYLLTTNYNNLTENRDYNPALHWGFREINLEIEPYNLKNRLDSVKETSTKYLNLYQL